MTWNLALLLPSDTNFKWKKRIDEPLMDFFNESDWLHIFPDVTSVGQFEDLMNMDCGQCFVAYNPASNISLGFIYVYFEDVRQKKVSVHGGSWTPNLTMLNYRAYIMLIEALLNQGYKVRTACRLDNIKATRFNKGIGFVNHYTSKNYRYFWISEKRLYSSKIYKRLIA